MIGRLERRRAGDRITSVTTTIGSGSTVNGSLTGNENCVLYGRFEGNCTIEGSVIVGTAAHWQGNIVADHIIIAGEVRGDVTALVQLELLATAHVTGRLSCRRIAIAQGAIQEGQIQMNADTEIVRFSERRAVDSPVALDLPADDG